MQDSHGCNRESGLEVIASLPPGYLLLQLEVGAGTRVVMLERRSDETLDSNEGGDSGIPASSEVE